MKHNTLGSGYMVFGYVYGLFVFFLGYLVFGKSFPLYEISEIWSFRLYGQFMLVPMWTIHASRTECRSKSTQPTIRADAPPCKRLYSHFWRSCRYPTQSVSKQAAPPPPSPGGNCIKIGLPGKLILRDYFQENRTSRRHFLLLRISFPGRPIFIKFIPGLAVAPQHPPRRRRHRW